MPGGDQPRGIRGKLLFRADEPCWIVVNTLLGEFVARDRVTKEGTFTLEVHVSAIVHVAKLVTRSKMIACKIFEMDAEDRYLEFKKGEHCLND